MPVMRPAPSRWIQLHSLRARGSWSGQRLSSWRSFLPARARRLRRASATTPTAQRRRGRRRALGKAIGVYGTVWRRRVSRKLRSLPAATSCSRLVGRTFCGSPSAAAASLIARGAGGRRRGSCRRRASATASALVAGWPSPSRSRSGWALAELFTLGLERLVGLPLPAPRAAVALGAVGARSPALALVAVGFAGVLPRAPASTGARRRDGGRHRRPGGRAAGGRASFLLRVFSVFTTVSTMGVVLGVASLVVVLAVTSGFEREFQDKVLALNAHLIVHALRRRRHRLARDRRHRAPAARACPASCAWRKFLFSAGEVMIGRVGANLKGIDLKQGADDLRRALDRRAASRIWTAPASCPLPAGTPRKATDRTSGASPSAPSWRTSCTSHVGDCVSIMVPFSSGVADAPPSYPVQGRRPVPHGLQRVRHAPRLRQHRGRAAAGERAPAGVRASSCASPIRCWR